MFSWGLAVVSCVEGCSLYLFLRSLQDQPNDIMVQIIILRFHVFQVIHLPQRHASLPEPYILTDGNIAQVGGHLVYERQ